MLKKWKKKIFEAQSESNEIHDFNDTESANELKFIFIMDGILMTEFNRVSTKAAILLKKPHPEKCFVESRKILLNQQKFPLAHI